MVLIKNQDLIQSIADGLQYISYYHPLDYITALGDAYQKEKSPAAKDAIAQIITNSKMCAEGKRPICQDTGIVCVFLKIGMNIKFEGNQSLQDLVNEGVKKAYLNPENPLRASVLEDPAGLRKNTKDNTPAVVHYEIVTGDKLEVIIAAKGGGSENKSKFAMLEPSDSIEEWVIKTLPTMGAGWCPPGIIGLGIGGTAEKAMLLAKESLMQPVNIHELIERGAQNKIEELRLSLYRKINALGIGAQGLGGIFTILDIKIKEYPTHAVSLPVAMIPNCAATRHLHFTLDGTSSAKLIPPDLSQWPKVEWRPAQESRRINLDQITKDQLATFKPGETLLLTGKLLTGRDAAHKRIADILAKGEELPKEIDFRNRFIYYVGPVNAVGDEAVGPAGPTTSTRMDKYTEMMLGQLGLIGMVGKSERGDIAIEGIKKHGAIYLIAVGGAAYLVAKAIKNSKVVAFADLGMEAIYEFEVENMPVTVAVDTQGTSVHKEAPIIWQQKF